jgi:hypothetical protein
MRLPADTIAANIKCCMNRSFARETYYPVTVSFLDNLENNLKALETADARDPEAMARQQAEQAAARDAARLAAPYAAALKSSSFTNDLLTAARTIGHAQRTMVRFHWREHTLILEAKDKKLELRPTAKGVVAVYFEGGEEKKTLPVNLKSKAEAFARAWLEI